MDSINLANLEGGLGRRLRLIRIGSRIETHLWLLRQVWSWELQMVSLVGECDKYSWDCDEKCSSCSSSSYVVNVCEGKYCL